MITLTIHRIGNKVIAVDDVGDCFVVDPNFLGEIVNVSMKDYTKYGKDSAPVSVIIANPTSHTH